MKRKIALEYIRIEFAKNGECTNSAMRYFVENRISRKAFDEAAQEGLRVYIDELQEMIWNKTPQWHEIKKKLKE